MIEYVCRDCEYYNPIDEQDGDCSKHGCVHCMTRPCKDFIPDKYLHPTEKEGVGE